MEIKHARMLAKLLDNQFEIFGLRFGLDPLIGLIPGIGDIVSVVLAGVIIKVAYDMGLPQRSINQMIAYIILDLVIGSIPVLGDMTDFFYKVNKKNLDILENFEREKAKIIEGEVVEER